MPRRRGYRPGVSVTKNGRTKFYWHKRRGRGRKRISKYTNRITRMKVSPSIIPDKTFLKLTKSQSFSFNASIDSDGNYFGSASFVGNGFDNVFQSVSVDTPAGLYVWAQFYQHYRILGSKISVVFNPTTQADSANIPIVGVIPYQGGFFGTYDSIADQPYVRWRLNTTYGSRPLSMRGMMKSKKMFGNSVTQEEDYQGSMSFDPTTNIFTVANPTSTWNWVIFMGSTASTPNVVSGFFTITYYVQLEDRLTQAALPDGGGVKGESMAFRKQFKPILKSGTKTG